MYVLKEGEMRLDSVKRIKELVELLQKASYAYYGQDCPIMSDKQYDDLYDELLKLEKETGCILAGSPTQKVQGYVIDSLNKVKHSKPMLSANKTKDISEIKKFIGNHKCLMSWKEDGLTIVLRYINGIFTQAITRGLGDIGEDVTHTMKMCKNIPIKLPYCTDIEVRGECVISWKEFERINSCITDTYKHPRNLAAGSVRQLDSNILEDRELTFIAFELVQDEIYNDSKKYSMLKEQIMNIDESFNYLEECGFDVVEHEFVTKNDVEDVIKKYIPENYNFPVDGLIFEYNDYLYGKSLGETSHHPLNMMALKWEDELYETILKDIEWNTSKTGLINPIAVFDPVDLEGAITSRATLHNVSYIEDLQLGIGDTIQVYRANMVIPKVHNSITKSNTWKLPSECPCCGRDVEIHNENGSKTLYCINPDCKAKLLGKLSHFVSKNAINIDGLSEQTLQKFIDLGWLSSFRDIYYLSEHKEEMYKLDGFGKKSVDKLLESIDKSRNTTLDRFIYGLCIPLIGRTASKTISKEFNNKVEEFYDIWCHGYDFTKLNDFGDTMNNSMQDFIEDNYRWIAGLIGEFIFRVPDSNDNVKQVLDGKIFVITGSLNFYKNREELVSVIERNGGKVSGSISTKTSYLINNDATSTSGKNKKANELGIPIISENEFVQTITS